jgi:GH25 family lysozyme M1 (1,4-beta-N-acetylmuramidase)
MRGMPYRWFVAGFALAMAAGFLTSATPVSANHASLGHGATQAAGPDIGTQAVTAGIDVNRWNNTIDWTSIRDAGVEFAYLKATEGASTKDPNFNIYYPATYYAGLVRGAYHVGLPNLSSGTVQATTSPATAARGRRTTKPCRARSTWSRTRTRAAAATA